MNKNTILSVFLILILIIILIFLFKDQKENKIRIAVCPTYLSLIKDIYNDGNYEIFPTQSTSESFSLFKDKQVDIVLSGRTLKPDEPLMEKIVIEKGYSFLGKIEDTIYEDQLKEVEFYTDLDIEEIKKNLSLNKIYKVEDIYNYLDDGILITSWENTDYNKAQIVHVLGDNNERLKISRQLTIYFPEIYQKEAQAIVEYLNKKLFLYN